MFQPCIELKEKKQFQVSVKRNNICLYIYFLLDNMFRSIDLIQVIFTKI